MLKVYQVNPSTNQFVEVSQGDLTSPILTNHDSSKGSSSVKKLFLRNDSDDFTYSNISVYFSPENLVSPSNSRKFKYKLLKQDDQPSDSQWQNLDSGNEITFSEINNQNYYPFWIQITVPPRTPAVRIEDVQLSVRYESVQV